MKFKKKERRLTREFMEKHGDKNSKMKLDWNSYMIALEKEEQERARKEREKEKKK